MDQNPRIVRRTRPHSHFHSQPFIHTTISILARGRVSPRPNKVNNTEYDVPSAAHAVSRPFELPPKHLWTSGPPTCEDGRFQAPFSVWEMTFRTLEVGGVVREGCLAWLSVWWDFNVWWRKMMFVLDLMIGQFCDWWFPYAFSAGLKFSC